MCQYVIVRHKKCGHTKKNTAYCSSAPLVRKHLGTISWWGLQACHDWESNKKDDELYKKDTRCWSCHGEVTTVALTQTTLPVASEAIKQEAIKQEPIKQEPKDSDYWCCVGVVFWKEDNDGWHIKPCVHIKSCLSSCDGKENGWLGVLFTLCVMHREHKWHFHLVNLLLQLANHRTWRGICILSYSQSKYCQCDTLRVLSL